MGRSGRIFLSAALLGLLVSSVLLVVVLGYLALVVAMALETGTPIVGVLLDLAVPYLPIVAGLVVVLVLAAVGAGWELLRRLSVPRSARLQSAFERIERRTARAVRCRRAAGAHPRGSSDGTQKPVRRG